MFKNTIYVPLVSKEETKFDEIKFNQILNDQELLTQMRKYILLLEHYADITLQNYHIPAEVSEYCQNIFIEQRKSEQEATGNVITNADTFHNWLTMARFESISNGELALTQVAFEKVRSLE